MAVTESRKKRDERLARYESPAFAAGRAAARVREIGRILGAVQQELMAVQEDIREWQEHAAERMGYQYARK